MRREAERVWLRVGQKARDAGPVGYRTYLYSHTGYFVAREKMLYLSQYPIPVVASLA